MRLKWMGDQAVVVPELGRDDPIEPGEIIEADTALGRRMAKSPMWKITSRDKDDSPEDEEEEG